MTINVENLGPAERILQTLLTYVDHSYHGRPGIVTADPSAAIRVKWSAVTHREEGGVKNVYSLTKVGKKVTRTKLGVMGDDKKVRNGNAVVGEYRPAGLFSEVCVFLYNQLAEIYKLDNEFLAKFASYQFSQENRDLKVLLAAFCLVQNRKGDPVLDDGKVIFHDEDYRNVGEAMCLIQRKDGKDLNPKLLMRIHDILTLPEIAKINRELGFGKSARNPFLGRWTKAVEKWLSYREENPKLLEGLVKAGFKSTVMDLCRAVGYKGSEKFFQTLRWKQKQAKDGRRNIAIGVAVKEAESWAGLTEKQICERIVKDRPNYKKIVGMLPKEIGLTKAIFAAAWDSGCLSDRDVVILTPTIEALSLLEIPEYKAKFENSCQKMTDMRSANILKNVQSKEAKDALQAASEVAVKKATEEALRGIKVWFCIDISGSMADSLVRSVDYLTKILPAFPNKEDCKVCVFNTVAREVNILHPSKVGVAKSLNSYAPGGGTNHSAILDCLGKYKPSPDQDLLVVWVGDQQQWGTGSDAFRRFGIQPAAFAMVKVGMQGNFVAETATNLGIPMFELTEESLQDPYNIPRVLNNLIRSTPVQQSAGRTVVSQRKNLVTEISSFKLLEKPQWA